MTTKAWIIVLVDRRDLHLPHALVSMRGRRCRQLHKAMLFGSRKRAEAFIRKEDERTRSHAWSTPGPWGAHWLPVPLEIHVETGENASALLDIHAEMA